MAARSRQRTHETDADASAFIASIGDPRRRADAETLVDLMSGATGEPPRLWGGSIVGFGRYHYRYESGHEGDSCLVGFSPRKSEFSIYLMGTYLPEAASAEALLGRLGKHRMAKACLYVKRLSDVDRAVLRELVERSVAALRERFPSD